MPVEATGGVLLGGEDALAVVNDRGDGEGVLQSLRHPGVLVGRGVHEGRHPTQPAPGDRKYCRSISADVDSRRQHRIVGIAAECVTQREAVGHSTADELMEPGPDWIDLGGRCVGRRREGVDERPPVAAEVGGREHAQELRPRLDGQSGRVGSAQRLGLDHGL